MAFGYICQECGNGVIVSKNFKKYTTKTKDNPILFKNARIGVCGICGAKHFEYKEAKRLEDGILMKGECYG